MESKTKTVLKTISWRILATITTMALIYLFTKRITLSIEIGILEVVIKMIVYYFHERLWLKIKLGSKVGSL